MSPSDFVGGVAGVCLAVAPVKDQLMRLREHQQTVKEKTSPLRQLRQALGRAWSTRRNGYDGLDSFLTMSGALGITLAFAMKAAGA